MYAFVVALALAPDTDMDACDAGGFVCRTAYTPPLPPLPRLPPGLPYPPISPPSPPPSPPPSLPSPPPPFPPSTPPLSPPPLNPPGESSPPPPLLPFANLLVTTSAPPQPPGGGAATSDGGFEMSLPIVLTLSGVGGIAILMIVGGYCAVRSIRNSKFNLRKAVAAASAPYDPSSASKCVGLNPVCVHERRQEKHTGAYFPRPSCVKGTPGGAWTYESEVSSRGNRRISAMWGWWCWAS